MFTIQGYAIFTESDMYVGEEMEKTLINEGFGVKKNYMLTTPAQLRLEFGVEKKDDFKAGTLFNLE